MAIAKEREGGLARDNGLREEDCPYSESGLNRGDWVMGWRKRHNRCTRCAGTKRIYLQGELLANCPLCNPYGRFSS